LKPETLLDPETLPDDLQWLVREFKLSPKDPVFLLIAWHWHQVQRAEDRLGKAQVELQSGIDGRLESLSESAQSLGKFTEQIARLREALEKRPELVSARVEAEIRPTVEKFRESEAALSALLQRIVTSQGSVRARELWAALLIGAMVGIFGGLILALA
jgi:hypothetical protein